MNREQILQRRIKIFTCIFILGLVASGLSAIPLEWEMNLLLKMLGAAQSSPDQAASAITHWLLKVRDGLQEMKAHYAFLEYGFDWLAFGHFVIAIAFVGALRNPLRNRWLYTFGMIACALLIPWAMVFGQVRGIPFGWRAIDCSFGVFGYIPLWLCQRWASELMACQERPVDPP